MGYQIVIAYTRIKAYIFKYNTVEITTREMRRFMQRKNGLFAFEDKT